MRKAAAGLGRKATSRRKQAQEQQNGVKQEEAVAPSNSPSNEQKPPKPGNDQQALTAKNYRLAKELSELRVRHREETKNVTRLTMENMNLASRCREAISHVAMLKKELAMHQRRAAEALAAQRQSMQRRPLSVKDTSATGADVAVEMDRIDRIIAAHVPQPLPPPPMPMVTAKAKAPIVSAINNGIDDTFDFEATSGENLFEDEDDEPPGDEVMVSTLSRAMFPHSPSPKIVEDLYNESFPSDLPPTRKLNAHFHQSPTLMETDTDDRSYSSSMSEDQSALSTQSETKRGSFNNIKAFDASFDTTFPSSFSNRSDEGLVALSTSSQTVIYNPFVPSPPKAARVGEESDITKVGVRDRSPMRRKVDAQGTTPKPPTPAPYTKATLATVPASPKPAEEREENFVKAKHSVRSSSPASLPSLPRSGGSRDTTSKNDIPRPTHRSQSPSFGSRLFPLSSPPQAGDPKEAGDSSFKPNGSVEPFSSPSRPTRFSTPVGINSQDASPDPEQPCRPEKSASATARARYEKALQPRPTTGPLATRNVGRLAGKSRFLNSDSEDDDPMEQSAMETEFKKSPPSETDSSPTKTSGIRSPSLVLKRLQQRRIKERMANDERIANAGDAESVGSSVSDTSGLSTNSEQLSIISGMSNSSSRVENRRRLVALRLSTGNSDPNSIIPFDEPDGIMRSARPTSSMNYNSLRAPGGRDEIIGQHDSSFPYYSGGFSNRDNKVDSGTTQVLSPNFSARGSRLYGSTVGADSSSNLSPDSMIKESHNLDAIANSVSQSMAMSPPPNADAATSRFATAGKLRRSVKQPISYTEPTLNSKLRRGDVYFEKSQDGDDVSPPQGGNDVMQDLTSAQVRI